MKTYKTIFASAFSILFLCIVQFSATAQTTMEEFMMKWENSKQFTLEVVEKMPDDLQNFKPHESAMKFDQQVIHLSSTIAGVSKKFLKGEDPSFDLAPKPANKEELKAYVTACYDYGAVTFSKLTEAQLAEKVEIFGSTVSRRQIISLIDDHCTHHRGAAIAYIRANGIEPPRFIGI